MKRALLILSFAFAVSQTAFAQAPEQLVGTWNVTSTSTGDYSLESAPKAGASAYIWLVNVSKTGEVTVNVQGETTFPKLQGYWRPATRTLILKAHAVGMSKSACWFKLVLNEKGVLHGVRRYLDSNPDFADFEIVAKKS